MVRNPIARARALLASSRGNTAVEFGIIGPFFILLILGVMQFGLIMQNYNAVRNLASDGARFAAVEYQKGTNSPTSAIETWMRARAVSGAYNLDTDLLTITVTQATTSSLTGLKQFDIAISYAATDYLWSVVGDTMNVSASKSVFVPG